MNPSYQQIAELFGAPKFVEGDAPPSLPRKSKGSNAQESEDLGRQCLNDGDYEAAIKHFRNAIEQRDASDIKARVELAGVYEYAEMAPQALRQYERALRIQQDADEAHVGLSQIYKRYGRYKDSIAELEEAIRLQPKNAFYHFKLAETFREVGEKERALRAAQGAVTSSPSEAFYHYWIGDLLIEMRRFSDALESLRAAIELSPGDDFLYLRAAVAFWGADRKQEAVKAVRLASDLDPSKDLYHGVLELFLSEMGLEEEAAMERKRGDRMDNYDLEAMRRLSDELDI
jgi:tetratricopeptide (TPR) repeat protein